MNKHTITDAEIYYEYQQDYSCNISRSFSILTRAIDDKAVHMIDIDVLEKECSKTFRIIRLAKKLEENPLVSYDETKKKFKVMKSFFSNLDEAIKAAELKVFL